VNGTPQISGVTSNDFSAPVVYHVVAEDGIVSKDWTVTVVKGSVSDAHANSHGDADADNHASGIHFTHSPRRRRRLRDPSPRRGFRI
jgi:hypothetical protein